MSEKVTKGARCAVYTRKSSEEGLEQAFNSLDAQREAGEAYIKSQAGEGWKPIRTRYDDGGVSGGTMDRPALQQLLTDIRERRVDTVVVYKVDRLTRSLPDFAKIVEVFDRHGVSFVSVTQQFNTTTSMGRLTLNMLLSFAQFEREITGERIRDKIAASKKKGIWMGGFPPLGYDVMDRKLVVNEAEAETLRHILQRYVDLGSVRSLKAELDAQGVISKVRVSQSGRRWGGQRLARGVLYRMLGNRIYLGEIVHKDKSYPGDHEPIISQDLWQAVQLRLAANRIDRKTGGNARSLSLLAGLLFDGEGHPMTPSHAVKNGIGYRYYVSRPLSRGTKASAPHGRRVPASEIERLIVDRVRAFLADEAQVFDAIGRHARDLAEQQQLVGMAGELAMGWPELSPAAAHSILRVIVAHIDILAAKVEVHLMPAAVCYVLRSESFDPLIAPSFPNHTERLILSVTAALKRIGKNVRMVIPGPGRTAWKNSPDATLIKLIGKAHQLNERLVAGGMSISEIAGFEGVHRSYIGRLLRLAYLAPDITEAIIDGRQPPGLNAAWLLRASRLPLDWGAQRRVLGFM
jgi:DNA invertase Pin-like site-specific DNA recombinase